MADEQSTNGNGREDSGSRDRATVALVDAKIDGIRDLVRAEFATVKEDIRSLAGVVKDVISQGVQLDDHERRLNLLEQNKRSNREWRRVTLPSLIFSGLVAIGAIIDYITQIH